VKSTNLSDADLRSLCGKNVLNNPDHLRPKRKWKMLVISDKELMSSAVLEEWDEYLEEKEKKGGGGS
jgi:hypothetical protein